MEFVNTLIKNLPTFGEALLMTLELAAVAILLALILGIIFGLFTVSGFKILEILSAIYIDIIRGTPLLVQTFIIYYGLAQSLKPLGFSWSNIGGPFTAGVVALSLNAGAYMAEIIRGGIQSVDKGQMEAARSLGFHQREAMTLVILPQAVRNILPALGNEFVTIIKESSIVSVISIADLMFRAKGIIAKTYSSLECLAVVAIIYFLLTFLGGRLIALMERRMSYGRKK